MSIPTTTPPFSTGPKFWQATYKQQCNYNIIYKFNHIAEPKPMTLYAPIELPLTTPNVLWIKKCQQSKKISRNLQKCSRGTPEIEHRAAWSDDPVLFLYLHQLPAPKPPNLRQYFYNQNLRLFRFSQPKPIISTKFLRAGRFKLFTLKAERATNLRRRASR
jgi:hypothetical protein